MKKLIAPFLIMLAVVLCYGGYALVCLLFPGLPWIVKLIAVLIMLALSGTMIAMYLERRDEVKSGEEDDLDKC